MSDGPNTQADNATPKRRIIVLGAPNEMRSQIAQFIRRTERFAVGEATHLEFEEMLRSTSPTPLELPDLALVVVERDASAVVSMPPYVATDGRRIPLLGVHPADALPEDDEQVRSDVFTWPQEAAALRRALSTGLTASDNLFVSSYERASIVRAARLRESLTREEDRRPPRLEVSGRDIMIPSSMPPTRRVEILRAARDLDPKLELCPVSTFSTERSTLGGRVETARRLLRDAPEVDSRAFPIAPHAGGLAVVGSARTTREAGQVVKLCADAAGVHPLENLIIVNEKAHEVATRRAEAIGLALREAGAQSVDVAVSGSAVYVSGRDSGKVAHKLESIVSGVIQDAHIHSTLRPPQSEPVALGRPPIHASNESHASPPGPSLS